MRVWSLAAAFLFVLAGCSEPEAQPTPPVAEPEGEEPVPLEVMGSYEFVLTSVKTPVNGANSGGQNCLMLDDRGTINGTATITWTPEPGMPEMELLLMNQDDLIFRTGDGEIVLEFTDFVTGGKDGQGTMMVWQASQGALAGASFETAATLALDLEFLPEESGEEFSPEEGWTCSVGH